MRRLTMLSTVMLTAGAALGWQDAVDVIDELFALHQAGEPIPETAPADLATRPRAALTRLGAYASSEQPETRHLAYSLVWQVGSASSDRTIRRDVTARLLEAAGDPDALVSQHASRWLVGFDRADFDAATRAGLADMLDDAGVQPALVRVIGSAGMDDALPALEKLLIDEAVFETGRQAGRWYGTVGWSARLARARLGVREDLDRAIELVEAEPDTVVRVTLLLGDLAYTGQAGAYAHIAGYLASPQRLPPIKPGDAGMPVAQYALHALAANAPGFPIAPRFVGGYGAEEIARALRWAAAGQ